jgi:pilus assembly protein CpaE
VADNHTRLLKKARRAFKTGERGRAAYLIDRILKEDYHHRDTWRLLYHEYGSGQSFEEFQREFTQEYYPEKLDLLQGKTGQDTQPARPVARRSLWSRLFGSRKQPEDIAPAEIPIPPAKTTPPPEKPARSTPQPSPGIDTPTQPVTQKKEASAAPVPRTTGKLPATPEPAKPPAQVSEVKSKEPQESQIPLPTATGRGDRPGVIRVLVVDDTPQTRETIIRSLRFQPEIEVIASAENGLRAIELSRQTKPDVVLMDVNMPDMDGISATARILSEVPYAQVVILTVQDDPDYMRKAMMAGAHDFLTKPPALDDLITAVQQAGKVAHQEKRKASQTYFATSRHTPSMTSRGKIISVYSPKGGIGCSVVAVNLAATLHNEETNTVLVDANLQFGDIADLFNLQSNHSLLDLSLRASDLDFQVIEENLVAHPSGIRILASPGPEQADQIDTELFIEVLEYLRDLFPYVLVNTTSQLSEITISALEISDLLILIASQDIPTIARVRKFIDTLQLLSISPERVLVVLNRFDKRSDLNQEVIEKSIKHAIQVTIPKDVRVVAQSVNRGLPFMLKSDLKPQPVSRAMLNLAENVRQELIKIAEMKAASESEPARSRQT